MKKILNYICCIIIILVGLFDVLYGANYGIKQYDFIRTSPKTTANIYQTTNRDDNKQVLYITYYVKNQKYDGVLVLNEEKAIKSVITIYYDEKNPLNIKSGEIDKSYIFVIVMGFMFFLLGIILLIKYYSKNTKLLKS